MNDFFPQKPTAALFHRFENGIDRRKAAGHVLDRDHLARDDAVAREQLLRNRRGPCSRPVTADRSLADGRPSPFARLRREPPGSKNWHARSPMTPRRDMRARVDAKRVKRVVGDQSFPDQLPDRVESLAWIAAANGVMQRPEKRGAASLQVLQNRRGAIFVLLA